MRGYTGKDGAERGTGRDRVGRDVGWDGAEWGGTGKNV